MRILLIHQAFVGAGEPGGTRHAELSKYWIARGHGVTVVTSSVSYLTGDRISSAQGVEEVNGVRVIRAYAPPTLHRSFLWRVISFAIFMGTSTWKGLRSGPCDVVLGTSPPIFQAVSAWAVATLRRKPFVLEIRDLWPAFAVEMGILRNRALVGAAKLLEHFLYARATHIVGNSPAYRDYLLSQSVRSEKVSIIPNGVDTVMFDPSKRAEDVRQRWGVDDKFVVTYAGALGLANDIPTVLRAAARLRDQPRIHFVFVGDGKERPRLERLAQEKGLNNVRFLGAVPKNTIPDALAASDVCVATLQNIPMFAMTYPNKVFDYMASGRPTVLAIDGVIRRVIEDANGGIFVSPGDDEALARVIQELANDPTRCVSLGRAARRYVEENFDRVEQALRFLRVLENYDDCADARSLASGGGSR